MITRRRFLQQSALLAVAATHWTKSAAAPNASVLQLPFANGRRLLVDDFPQKGAMILLRSRPPLLETPFEVFDQGMYTPNDRFFVRWHLADVPTRIDTQRFRLVVRGQVQRPLSLSLDEITRSFEPVDIVAVNQCSGNSRGFFQPQITGGEWGNGAMGNARWTGVRLKDVLDRAGIRGHAVQVRFGGLDRGVIAKTPDFLKALDVDHARDGEVIIAYAMNGAPLPLLNGYPLRLVVPGWFSTYWVKMLNDIEVLDHADDNYWMATAYKIPATPNADMRPGQADVDMVPITRLAPRSFFTNLRDGATLRVGQATLVRGLAFGGDAGVSKVSLSTDAGTTWRDTRLGEDHGKYSFRLWQTEITPAQRGTLTLAVRTVNSAGAEQPARANWNPGGYQRNVIETMRVVVI